MVAQRRAQAEGDGRLGINRFDGEAIGFQDAPDGAGIEVVEVFRKNELTPAPPPQPGPARASPLLGLQIFSMPCRMSTMRDSSVKDSMTLKLHSGLTSKKVMQFFSA